MASRKRKHDEFEFDAAISFAGEERHYAKDLAETLRREGLSVFYDEHHKARLWGKDEREFERIYGPASRFVIPIISTNYVRKTWPRFEFETALREEQNRPSESILPIRVDKARLPGLHDGRFYLSLSENSIAEIATCIIEKCKQEYIIGTNPPARKRASQPKPRVAILSGDAKHVLGLIVASQLPLPVGLFKGLFPDLDWTSHCRALAKNGLIETSNDHITPSKEAVNAIRSDETQRKSSTEQWVKRLEELKAHSDIALYLSIHYMSERRWDDAIDVLVDVANNGLHGHLNETYFRCLERFVHEKILQKLTPVSRIKLFHALAISATQADRFEEALRWYEKVRRESVKAGDNHWLGQYFINSGVAFNLAGDTTRASAAFRKAIEHGKAHGSPSLVGRSLGNLAQVRLAEDDPDAAIELMSQSIEWKKKAKDDYGSAVSSAQLGSIEATRGNLRAALAHFTKAEAMFAERELIHDQAKSAYNIGTVYADLRQIGNAQKAYKRAQRLASEDDDIEVQLLATQGLARVYHPLGRFAEIEKEFDALLRSPVATKASEVQLSAHYGVGIAQAMLAKRSDAKEHLQKALRLSRKLASPEWTAKILVTLSGISSGESYQDPPPQRVAQLASREEKRGNTLLAAKLWEITANGFIQADNYDQADDALQSTARCLQTTGDPWKHLVAIFFRVFALRWLSCRYEASLDALAQAERTATEHKLDADRLKAIDEHGLALQRLGRPEEALPLHSRAVTLARKQGLTTQLRISLNNYGQAYRRLGKYKEAMAPLQESETLARAAGDHEDALGTMVNRGIVLQEAGDYKAASAILRKCAAEAERRELWRELAMAQEALGNLAWHRGRLKEAEKHYRDGHAIAKKRNVKESEAEIAVNYASLLNELGKSKQALKILQAYEPKFSRMMEAHVCHHVLGTLYLENGDSEAAKRNWEAGRSFARIVGNSDYIALCSANLADVEESEGNLAAAERELEVALAHEPDPALRASLLSDLLRIVLGLRNDEKATKVFADAQRIARKHELSDILIDSYMRISDYNWREDLNAKQDALRGYVAAIIEALSHPGEEHLPKVLGHIVSTLTDGRHAASESEFDSLIQGLKKALPALAASDNDAAAVVRWPFETARRLLPFVGDKDRYLAELQKITKNGILPRR